MLEWNRIIDLIELPVPDSAREVVNLDENLKGESKAIFSALLKWRSQLPEMNGSQRCIS